VTKEFSLGPVERQFDQSPVRGLDLVGFAWQDERTYLRGEVQHITPLGAGLSADGHRPWRSSAWPTINSMRWRSSPAALCRKCCGCRSLYCIWSTIRLAGTSGFMRDAIRIMWGVQAMHKACKFMGEHKMSGMMFAGKWSRQH